MVPHLGCSNPRLQVRCSYELASEFGDACFNAHGIGSEADVEHEDVESECANSRETRRVNISLNDKAPCDPPKHEKNDCYSSRMKSLGQEDFAATFTVTD